MTSPRSRSPSGERVVAFSPADAAPPLTSRTTTPSTSALMCAAWRRAAKACSPPRLTPSAARLMWPWEISWSTIFFTVSMGIAKPMPALDCEALIICELMPTTSPSEFSKGPPLFPGLMAASVWITPSMGLPLWLEIWRPVPETTPVVSVWSRPNGFPMASTDCPTCNSAEVPSLQGTNLARADLSVTCTTAMSVSGSTATNLAVHAF
mmetsp:Transcript_131587/g.227945  ORF Transcript_131587/g.227945 Transcript_131587/m.227945 type:complete len:208 (-) Transcript_131587:367-990(-)